MSGRCSCFVRCSASSYDEIAGAVGKSAAAVRQMAHRAREHVQSRRKRFGPVDAKRTAQITEQFLTAASTGDMDGLLTMLAPEAVWTADSEGKAAALPRPIVGARKVAGVMLGCFRAARRMSSRIETAIYNNAPAVKSSTSATFEGVFVVEIIDDQITNFYAMRNPDKLAGIAIPRAASAASVLSRLLRADRAARRPGQRPCGAARRRRRRPPGAGLPPPAALIGEWFDSRRRSSPRR